MALAAIAEVKYKGSLGKLNSHLASLLGRTVESIKGMRRRLEYKALVNTIRSVPSGDSDDDVDEFTTPPHQSHNPNGERPLRFSGVKAKHALHPKPAGSRRSFFS